MRQIIQNYSFNPSIRTITFTDFKTISLQRVILVTNVTTNTILYTTDDPNRGGSVSGNVLTLRYDTRTMASTHILQVIYDTLAGDPIYDAYFDPAANASVTLATALAGEDLTNNVLGVIDKPVITAEYDLLYSTSFGTAVSVCPKPTPGNVYSFFASNENGAKRYFQLHNRSTAPATGNVPILSVPIPAGTPASPSSISMGRDVLGDNGRYCSSGIAWGISTTRSTFTAATPANHDAFLTFV